jgi:hypothetical protein
MLSNAPQSIVQGKAVFIFTKTVFYTTVIYENIKWKKNLSLGIKFRIVKRSVNHKKKFGCLQFSQKINKNNFLISALASKKWLLQKN